jgi:hypothetical protein
VGSPKFSAVTVTRIDGSVSTVPPMSDYEVKQSLLPKSQRKHRNDVSFGHDVDYKSYLASKKWFDRRDKYFKTHAKRCRACASKAKIHLHHMTYERLGSERDTDLIALCEVCHTNVHKLHKNSTKSLRWVTQQYVAGARGVGEQARKRGERRLRRCAPAKAKPAFIPANLRAASTDENGRVVTSRQFDPVNAALGDSG